MSKLSLKSSEKRLQFSPLPTPQQVLEKAPLANPSFIEQARKLGQQLIQGNSPLFAIILGPCSIHDPDSALEYGKRIKELSEELGDSLFLIMRCFVEKPRSRRGWKGFLYDPYLDGSNDLASGIQRSRKLLLDLTDLQVPCAMEFLEPLAAPYLADLISWGFIGARTPASQPLRQLASGLPCPVGFKNSIDGSLEDSISGILAAQDPHTHFGIDPQGKICSIQTRGNPFCHLVLRGSKTEDNYHPPSVAAAIKTLKQEQLKPSLLIDCSHGNSGKNPSKQPLAFQCAIQQKIEGNHHIIGAMLESHLHPGNQIKSTAYGVSITDPCLGWEETAQLLRWAAAELPTSISSVQNGCFHSSTISPSPLSTLTR